MPSKSTHPTTSHILSQEEQTSEYHLNNYLTAWGKQHSGWLWWSKSYAEQYAAQPQTTDSLDGRISALEAKLQEHEHVGIVQTWLDNLLGRGEEQTLGLLFYYRLRNVLDNQQDIANRLPNLNALNRPFLERVQSVFKLGTWFNPEKLLGLLQNFRALSLQARPSQEQGQAQTAPSVNVSASAATRGGGVHNPVEALALQVSTVRPATAKPSSVTPTAHSSANLRQRWEADKQALEAAYQKGQFATPAEIESFFTKQSRQLSLKYHPDKNPQATKLATEIFQELVTYFEQVQQNLTNGQPPFAQKFRGFTPMSTAAHSTASAFSGYTNFAAEMAALKKEVARQQEKMEQRWKAIDEELKRYRKDQNEELERYRKDQNEELERFKKDLKATDEKLESLQKGFDLLKKMQAPAEELDQQDDSNNNTENSPAEDNREEALPQWIQGGKARKTCASDKGEEVVSSPSPSHF
jgi:hypothetical protein